MVGVVPDAIGCVFSDLTTLKLRILDRVDFGHHFEFRASDGKSISSIAFGTTRASTLEGEVVPTSRAQVHGQGMGNGGVRIRG
ncbi:hypothetical protein H5410_037171 [Solanum commersonii]|uniref:Uncharacterized protein n=1 Tax=Solanum commersonii TaxID=4109 RepID=A0A9J5Y5J1_SOLCO|nr:hypothetical protein H5410_037171 [Solanum commersonii]